MVLCVRRAACGPRPRPTNHPSPPCAQAPTQLALLRSCPAACEADLMRTVGQTLAPQDALAANTKCSRRKMLSLGATIACQRPTRLASLRREAEMGRVRAIGAARPQT